jgi:DNA-binding NarL/FixJ family response regulator
MDKVTVLLVDDHPVVREGLRSMLATVPDIEVVAEAGDGLEAVEKANEHRPNVVLMDLRMPDLDGLEATQRIKSQLPATSVIMLTVYDNDAYIVDAVRAGAGGFLLKDASKDLIIHAIRAVNSGGMLIKAGLLHKVMLGLTTVASDQPRKKQAEAEVSHGLTPREREVLSLVVLGLTNKEIGRALHISDETAKKHVQTILSKLDVSDRTQAAVKAVQGALVSLPLPQRLH